MKLKVQAPHLDAELKELPSQLVAELGRRYRARWIILNKGYYK